MARADGSLRSLLTRLSRIDVLVIDDWVMAQHNAHRIEMRGDSMRRNRGDKSARS